MLGQLAYQYPDTPTGSLAEGCPASLYILWAQWRVFHSPSSQPRMVRRGKSILPHLLSKGKNT